MAPHTEKVPSWQIFFHCSSVITRIESLIRNLIQQNVFLISLYWYFLPVNYTNSDFFLTVMRQIFSTWRVGLFLPRSLYSCCSLHLGHPCPAVCLPSPFFPSSLCAGATSSRETCVTHLANALQSYCRFCFKELVTVWHYAVQFFVYYVTPLEW